LAPELRSMHEVVMLFTLQATKEVIDALAVF
jgi:hypothetical protein